MNRSHSNISDLLVTQGDQIHKDVDFFFAQPSVVFPFLKISKNIALVAVLCGDDRLSPKSLIVFDFAQETTSLRHIGVLDSS